MIGHDPNRIYRAAIIGAGSGGLTAAIGLAGFGHSVVLIEGGRVGGDCTNVGCIPSKALLHAARTGIADPLAFTRAKRDDLAAREDDDMADDDRIHLVRGWATLTHRRGPHVVAVIDGDTVHNVRADHIVIAGGSRPATLDIAGLDADRVVTNEELFELSAAPASLVIIGGGPIGVEMATAFAAIGTRVDIVELQAHLLPNFDRQATEVVTRALTEQGIGVHLGASIERMEHLGGTAVLTDGTVLDDVEQVLMAVGRQPRLDGLGLETAGVEVTRSGVVTDAWGRTSVPGIWAVGDITGGTLTTHGAGAVGRRIVRAIALPRLPKIGSLGAVPTAVYSDPEVASVGRSAIELATFGDRARRRLVVEHSDIDRGYTDDIVHGRLVIDVERFTGKILHATIVGPGAADMIGMFTIAIDNGIGLRALFGTVHPYPSHAELLRQAADDFARVTYSNLLHEWSAMAVGRARRLLTRAR